MEVGTIIRDDLGAVWYKSGEDKWIPLVQGDKFTLDESEINDMEYDILWEPDKMDGLGAGSIIQSRDVYTRIAVKNLRGGWIMNGGYYPEEDIREVMGKGGFDVVKGVR